MANPDSPKKAVTNKPGTSAEPTGSLQPTPVLSLRDVVVYPHMVIPAWCGN